jgi:molybdopterin molybdotransferase
MSECPTHGLMPVDTAIEILQQAGRKKLPIIEEVSLIAALGRVLAVDVFSAIDVPPQANSAMDGYAVNTADLLGEMTFSVSQRIAAGSQPVHLEQGTIARIFTGAVIPEGANAVVMQENCQLLDDGRIKILDTVKEQENIRPQGQDIVCGQRILQQGERLNAAAIGLLATIGKPTVHVYRPLKVAFFSTGDELIEAGKPLAIGQIYNSNRSLIHSLLISMGFIAIDGGVIADNLPATLAAFKHAAESADVIISTGGVSVGEEDHVKAAIQQCGELDLWKIAIKPGKPLAFGRVGDVPFIGLPGNPQSVWVTFLVLARQFLINYQGQRHKLLPYAIPVKSSFSIKKAQNRREYLRVRLEATENGLTLSRHANQSSGVLSSAVWADGLAIIEKGQIVAEGELLPFLSFTSLGVA